MIRRVNQKTYKICIICEGDEEYAYLSRLKELNVWKVKYSIKLKKANSIDNISAIYQNEYNNDNYDLILVLCDTETEPYWQYNKLKENLKKLFGKRKAIESVIYFSNPCTMQIILLHFDFVKLNSNKKSSNANRIKTLTGVDDYRATESQRKTIMNKITQDNYLNLKSNLSRLPTKDDEIPSTNFLNLLNNLESDDTKWIKNIIKKLDRN